MKNKLRREIEKMTTEEIRKAISEINMIQVTVDTEMLAIPYNLELKRRGEKVDSPFFK